MDIARNIECSRFGFHGILSKSDNFETKSRFGRPMKTTKQQDREIFRLGLTQNVFVWSLSKDVSVPASKSTIHRPLQASTFLDYRKIRRSSRFTEQHTDACVQSARNYIQ